MKTENLVLTLDEYKTWKTPDGICACHDGLVRYLPEGWSAHSQIVMTVSNGPLPGSSTVGKLHRSPSGGSGWYITIDERRHRLYDSLNLNRFLINLTNNATYLSVWFKIKLV